MSRLEDMCKYDGCVQCLADVALKMSPADIEADVRKKIQDDPSFQSGRQVADLPEPIAGAFRGALANIGMPILTDEDIETLVRQSRRAIRMASRVILLEPHECGKD
jgi:hypothetical protein